MVEEVTYGGRSVSNVENVNKIPGLCGEAFLGLLPLPPPPSLKTYCLVIQPLHC